LQFTAAHDVEAAAEVCQRAQYGLVGVGLHREANEVLHRGHRVVQFLEVTRQGVLRVNEKWSADFFCKRLDGDTFTKQSVSYVTKIMHGAGV
jgi:hypothetical protein